MSGLINRCPVQTVRRYTRFEKRLSILVLPFEAEGSLTAPVGTV